MLNLERMLKEALVSEESVLMTMEPMSRHTTFRIGGPASFSQVHQMKRNCQRSFVCAGNITFPGVYWEMAAIFWSVIREWRVLSLLWSRAGIMGGFRAAG